MDDSVRTAIVAVHLDDDAIAQRWFEYLCVTYEQAHPAWSQFTAALTDSAGSAAVDGHVVEQFVEHMNAYDLAPLDTVGRMTELRNELTALYRQQATATT